MQPNPIQVEGCVYKETVNTSCKDAAKTTNKSCEEGIINDTDARCALCSTHLMALADAGRELAKEGNETKEEGQEKSIEGDKLIVCGGLFINKSKEMLGIAGRWPQPGEESSDAFPSPVRDWMNRTAT